MSSSYKEHMADA